MSYHEVVLAVALAASKSAVMVSDTVDQLERLIPESTVPRLHALDGALHRDRGTTRKGPR